MTFVLTNVLFTEQWTIIPNVKDWIYLIFIKNAFLFHVFSKNRRLPVKSLGFFTETITWHVTWSMALLIMLRNVKDDKTFLSAKFQFIIIHFVQVFSNKQFFLFKALNPGLKLLEKENLVFNGIFLLYVWSRYTERGNTRST